MTELTGAICISENSLKTELSFEEILLDERLIVGNIWILKKALSAVGGINYRLKAKRNYELLIRIAREYKVYLLGKEEGARFMQEETSHSSWIQLPASIPKGKKHTGERDRDEETGEGEIDEALKTDCYLISRYQQELSAMNAFEDAVLGILSSCAGKDKLITYLERMISHDKEFYHLYDCTQPVLIYTGCDLCYNILDTFSAELGHSLEELGQTVEYFDSSKQAFEEITHYTQRRFKAIIGMQTNMFYAKWKTGEFVHNGMSGPKYNFLFDHPIWLNSYLEQKPHRLCALTPDGNYKKFIEEYFDHSARFLPPGGEYTLYEEKERDYEVSFLGSYGKGLTESLKMLKSVDRQRACFVNRYIIYMRRYLTETPEQAFKRALDYYGISYTKNEFLIAFHRERWVITELANYYRNKFIKTILDAGIKVHVFGNTWDESPLRGHPSLIHHEAVYGKDALKVYARTKLSLNVMRWHKDGFTERIANAMLQKALVITDKTAYLENNFTDGEDILLFDLNHLPGIPAQIKELLTCERKRKRIADNGFKKALQQHTWKNRAVKILEMIEEDEANH